jgi:GNAT superfamily N-acetyltransferase
MDTRLAENTGLSEPNGSQWALSDCEKRGEILFRRFRPDADDERRMRELVFNNAFLGQPFDAICPCKQWLGDVVLAPYVKYQPENIQVAIHKPSGRLIGYLTGSLGGSEFEKKQYGMVKKQVLSLAVALSMPWSLFDYSSRLFLSHVIFKGERERPDRPRSGAHWHFQVDKDFRGRGVGTALLRRFVREAIDADFELIWAEVTSYPEKPPAYFVDRGWSIHDARATEIFGGHVDFPVQTLCIKKPLSSLEATIHPV